MITPEFDSDGYPTDATLDAIEHWNIQNLDHCKDLIDFCIEAWEYDTQRSANLYIFNTGGWSGNESIIDAMKKNYVFWLFAWKTSTRGGHFEFELRHPPKEEDI